MLLPRAAAGLCAQRRGGAGARHGSSPAPGYGTARHGTARQLAGPGARSTKAGAELMPACRGNGAAAGTEQRAAVARSGRKLKWKILHRSSRDVLDALDTPSETGSWPVVCREVPERHRSPCRGGNRLQTHLSG